MFKEKRRFSRVFSRAAQNRPGGDANWPGGGAAWLTTQARRLLCQTPSPLLFERLTSWARCLACQSPPPRLERPVWKDLRRPERGQKKRRGRSPVFPTLSIVPVRPSPPALQSCICPRRQTIRRFSQAIPTPRPAARRGVHLTPPSPRTPRTPRCRSPSQNPRPGERRFRRSSP